MNNIRTALLGTIIACAVCAIAAAESLIAPGATLTKIQGDFTFIEGPTADLQGNVFFSDIPENRIYKLSTDGKVALHRENSGGANGLIIDADGNLLACEGTAQRITSMDKDGNISVVLDRFEDKRLNSPNDLWIDAKGGFYFTDPRYQFFTHPMEQDGENVYYVSPDRKTVTRVIDDIKKPNGIVGTKDGKKLYVADTSGRIFVFNVRKDATLSKKKEFVRQGSDGMTMDEHGNLYLTWMAGVTIYNPKGERLEIIKVPEMPANVGFGGKDGKTLIITARTSLYSIQMNVRGQTLSDIQN